MESNVYFVDGHGYLRKKSGTIFFKFVWDNTEKRTKWISDNYDLDTLLDYSTQALKSKNNFYDQDYVEHVLKYMKDQFYEEVLG